MSDNNLYGIAEELVISGDAWSGPTYVPHQYKTGFQIDTNSWLDTKVHFREFLKAFKQNYQSPAEVRNNYESP